ncbi:hypothetical protein ACOMHN_015439 [Nucella lapillus]
MVPVKSWKLIFVIVLALGIISIILSLYFVHGRNKVRSSPAFKSNFEAYFAGRFLQRKFAENELNKDYNLDLENEDVIVFLHIQKTGGTEFGKHLVENLDVGSPCNCRKRKKKRCNCLTKNKQMWLFSRFSTGWECGLHADWTELTTCVDDWFQSNYGSKKRRYHYITLLRDPVARFVSEWMHVSRGATWKATALRCNGRQATLEEVPFCFASKNWKGVTLDDFMSCKHNLAINRQTRMLANLSQINCYSAWADSNAARQRLMLDSAKHNLLNLAFLGLVEFQTYTQFLFEHTLNVNFIHDFEQENHTHSHAQSLTPRELKRIADLNHLDVELYQFAKDLFLQRVKQAFVDENLPVPQHLRLALQMDGEKGTKPSLWYSVEKNASEKEDKVLNHKRFISRHKVDTEPS